MFADRRIRTSLIAIGADVFLTALKLGLALTTGSAALLADAYHSGTDLVVSLVLLGSLVIRHRQERKANPVSSERARKFECVLAILVALLILYVPFEILTEVQQRTRQTIDYLWLGIGGTVIIVALVFFMARLKTHVGRETDSPALEADGYHSQIDLFSSLAVLVSLVGTLVGLYLDEIVALVIALLIAVAGIELLVSGVRALRRGAELDPVSLLDPLLERAARFPFSRFFLGPWRSAQSHWRALAGTLATFLVLAWLSTGFSVVPLGQVGIKSRFGAAAESTLAPGLHSHWPYPIELITSVPEGRVLSTTVGSRVDLPASEQSKKLWRELKATQAHEDDSLYLATRDENLVDIQLVVQYRLLNTVELAHSIGNVEGLVQRYAEAALWQTTAQRSFALLLAQSHHQFPDAIARTLQADLAGVGVNIHVVDVQMQALQPPAIVVAAYRDLLNAEQEKQQHQNRAEAQRIHDLLIAQAERIGQRASIEADAAERRLRAEGEAERFSGLATAFGEHGEALRFEQHLQATTQALSGRTLWLTDPALDSDDLRLWGPGGLMTDQTRK
ncbi:protease modulator HflK family protein [Marinimicrobium sp. C2-29]|uniref:protease modulator HflK family protein n=1 Tax=Marinimicrobium sp. C2-29 TaxID=3139825 RepID=UPI0031388C21